MDDDPDDLEFRRLHMRDLIERSSLGTPEAVAYRMSTPPLVSASLLHQGGLIDDDEFLRLVTRRLREL